MYGNVKSLQSTCMVPAKAAAVEGSDVELILLCHNWLASWLHGVKSKRSSRSITSLRSKRSKPELCSERATGVGHALWRFQARGMGRSQLCVSLYGASAIGLVDKSV